MPSFCRHNRLVQNCPICSREQAVELRPLVSEGTPGTATRPQPQARPSRTSTRSRAPATKPAETMRVRRLARGADDGYRSSLLPGLKSSEEAARLAEELAFSAYRLQRLGHDPPGLYGEVAALEIDLEERTWLAFLIAYFCPLEEPDPFAEIERIRTSWASGDTPTVQNVQTGPRTAHDAGGGPRTLDAYRSWATRSGSQQKAFGGELGWTPERRFERTFERLALPGLHRDARFDLLVTLGILGVYELEPPTLKLGGADTVTVAAKRALGIGDRLLLERRAAQLAETCELPLAALDLALYNWETGQRATLGVPGEEADPQALDRVRRAIEL